MADRAQMSNSMAEYVVPLLPDATHSSFLHLDISTMEDSICALADAVSGPASQLTSLQVGGDFATSALVLAYCGPHLLRLRLYDCAADLTLLSSVRRQSPALQELRLHRVDLPSYALDLLKAWPQALIVSKPLSGAAWARGPGGGRRKRGTARSRSVVPPQALKRVPVLGLPPTRPPSAMEVFQHRCCYKDGLGLCPPHVPSALGAQAAPP